MLGIQKYQWTTYAAPVLAFVALIAVIFASLKSSGDELKAEVVQVGDGTAKVIFQPLKTTNSVSVLNGLGEKIGQLNWAAEFEVSVTEDALRKATKKDGIDLNFLLKGIGTLKTVDGRKLVSAELPTAIKDLDGRELAAGTQVYFGLDLIAREGAIAPVVAWGGKSMGPGGAANNFNERLLERGVKKQAVAAETVSAPSVAPVTPQAAPVTPVAPSVKAPTSPAVAPPAVKAPMSSAASPKRQASAGVHGEGTVPLESVDDLIGLGERFASSPICTMNPSQKVFVRSFYGTRRSTMATNGEMTSDFHHGVDVAAAQGTPVVAAAPGCLSVRDLRLNEKTGYGISLVAYHDNGFSTQYGHMRNFSPKVLAFLRNSRSGGKFCFDRGEQLGNSGMTGRCTGPHLHFGMKKNGKSVNPRNYMIPQSNDGLSQTCTALADSNQRLKQAVAAAGAAIQGPLRTAVATPAISTEVRN